ncbi:MAG: tetratricopeptide repeat protein, partial [Saprospiraceae bacterium]
MKILPVFFALRIILLSVMVATVSLSLPAQASLPATLDSLERRLQTVTDPEEKTKTLNALSFQYVEIDIGKTLKYGQMALALAKEHGLTTELGRACNNIASHYLYSSDIDQAMHYYEQSYEYFHQAGEEKGGADVLGNLGHLNYYIGNYAVSLDYQLRALRIFEKLDNRLGMGNTMSAIGSVYMEQAQYGKAIHYDTIALNLYRELDDENGVALVLGNLGNIYSKQGQTEQARAAFLKAAETYEKAGNLNGVARNLSNLALIYHQNRDYIQALTTLEKARDLYLKSTNLIGFCNVTGNMGSSYYLSYKNFDRRDSIFQLIPGSRSTLLRESIRLFKEAVGMAQQSEDLKLLSGYSGLLAQAYEAAGDAPNAYAYFKIYTSAKDSLYSIDAKREIEKLTTEREVELKNKQIELDRLAVEKKRNERVYFIIGIGLLVLSVLFVYRNFANQKKS